MTLLLLVILPCPAAAESLTDGVAEIIDGLDASALEATLVQDDPFAATGGFTATLLAIAKGELSLDFAQTLDLLTAQLLSAVKLSLWRLTRLIAPAMIWAILRRLTGKGGEAGRVVCQL